MGDGRWERGEGRGEREERGGGEGTQEKRSETQHQGEITH